MSFGVRVVSDTFTPKLANASKRLRELVTLRIAEVGAEMMNYARNIVPVRTGFLRSSIFFQITRELEAYFGAAADYGMYVEYGTSRMAARPFIKPAVDAYYTQLLTAILQGILEVFK